MGFREPQSSILYSLASFAKRLILLYRSFRLRQVEIEDALSGKRMTYIGEGESLDYLKETCFKNGIERNAETLLVWRLNERIKPLILAKALIVVEVNRVMKHLIPAGGLLTFPWIRQKTSLDSSDYAERKRKIEGTFGRKARKLNYRYQITRDKKLVGRFFEEFYLPYVTRRFKHLCRARSISELQDAAQSGFLLQVFCKDLWVSGAICRVKIGEIRALAFGHLPEDQHDLHLGALSAAYYFIFNWAEEHSLQRVDLCRSRPNTGDGVYEHKRRWGAKPAVDSWPHTVLSIFLPPEEVCPFLKTQLIWDGDGFFEIQRLGLD